MPREHEIVVTVRGAEQIRSVCNSLQDAQAVQARGLHVHGMNCTVTIVSGLVLTCAAVSSYEVIPASPVQVDSLGRLVNAEIKIKYLEPHQ